MVWFLKKKHEEEKPRRSKGFASILAVVGIALMLLTSIITISAINYHSTPQKPKPEITKQDVGESISKTETKKVRSVSDIQEDLKREDYGNSPPSYEVTDRSGSAFEEDEEGVEPEVPKKCTIPKYYKVKVYKPEKFEWQGYNRKYLYFRLKFENEGNVKAEDVKVRVQLFYGSNKLLEKESYISLYAGEVKSYYIPFPGLENVKPGKYQLVVTVLDPCKIVDCHEADLLGSTCWGTKNTQTLEFELDIKIMTEMGMKI